MVKTYYRVWVHPVSGGNDSAYEFNTLREAVIWYNRNKNNPKFGQVERPIVAVGKSLLYAKERNPTSAELKAASSRGAFSGIVKNLTG